MEKIGGREREGEVDNYGTEAAKNTAVVGALFDLNNTVNRHVHGVRRYKTIKKADQHDFR